MKKRYAFLLITFCLLLITGAAQAQTWEWGQSGGSADGGIGSGPNEYAKDIAVDPNGNTYVLSRSVGKTSLKVGGQAVTKNFGSYDVMLSSFNCFGQLRWTKIIGCTREDFSYAVRTDEQDGVYFAFNSSLFSGAGTNELHFDTDKTITVNNTNGGKSYKSLFLAKYDTSGNYQWVVIPQADTVSVWSFTPTATIDLFVDAQGNIDWFCHLPKGQYNGSYAVNKTGNYIMQFDKNGNYKNGLELDMYAIGAATGFTSYMSKKAGKYYITGTVKTNETVTINGGQIKGGKYIAAFDNLGNLIWTKSDTSFQGIGLTNRPVVDDSGNIYIVGDTRHEDYFNGYTPKVSNYNPPEGGVLIMKLNKNGDMLWADNALVNNVGFTGGIALRNSGEVVVGGWYAGLLRFDSYKDSLFFGPNQGYRPFIARLNTQTGKVLGVEELLTNGSDAYLLDLIADGRNNIYISGEMKGSMTVNGNTLSSVGGPKDFYIAKYGHSNCNCTDIPEPKFTQTVTNHFTYDFTYTGSAATTIEWDFGDGTTSTQANPSHTYTSPNDFIACVKVTNNCGDNIYCAKISTKWPDNVATLSSNSNVKIYPNPASDILHIDGLMPGCRIELYDIVGRKALMITTAGEQEAINISHLPQGNYIIQITNTDGDRMTGKVLKK